MKDEDLARTAADPWWRTWGRNAAYPETTLRADLRTIQTRVDAMRLDR